LPETEINIMLTGDPEQKFDPYSYICIYRYPELARLVPEIQNIFNIFYNLKKIKILIHRSTNQLGEIEEADLKANETDKIVEKTQPPQPRVETKTKNLNTLGSKCYFYEDKV
jgi:hypothetical protein